MLSLVTDISICLHQGRRGKSGGMWLLFAWDWKSFNISTSKQHVCNRSQMEQRSCFHLLSPYKELWPMEPELSLQFDLQVPQCQNQMTQVPLCRCFFLLSYKFKNLSLISFQGTCKLSILKLKLIFLEDTLCLLPLNYTFSQILWTWRDSLSFRYSIISASSQDWGKNPLLCSHFILTFSPKQISVAEIPKLTVTPLLKISLKIWS